MEKKKKNNSLNIIIFGVIIVVILIFVLFLIKGCSSKDSNTSSDGNQEVEKKGSSEEDIKEVYGMSGEDAINLVKQLYNGDAYEFSYSINSDSKYVVTVKNLITEGITRYVVDPANRSFYQN